MLSAITLLYAVAALYCFLYMLVVDDATAAMLTSRRCGCSTALTSVLVITATKQATAATTASARTEDKPLTTPLLCDTLSFAS
eukprot:20022-Heterococcus_DN1.PRE.1